MEKIIKILIGIWIFLVGFISLSFMCLYLSNTSVSERFDCIEEYKEKGCSEHCQRADEYVDLLCKCPCVANLFTDLCPEFRKDQDKLKEAWC